jgi:hypothetical protein
MTQYERENAIDAIDGYWQPDPHFTEQNARKAFEAAKEQNRIHRLRALECIDAITFEQWLDAKPYVAKHLREYMARFYPEISPDNTAQSTIY